MIKNIIFDVDDTLLHTSDEFLKEYYKLVYSKYADVVDFDSFITSFKNAIKATYIKGGTDFVYNNYINSFNIGDLSFKEKEKRFLDAYKKFNELGKYTDSIPHMVESIEILKTKNINISIATNPLFPKDLNIIRLNWANIDYKSFDFISNNKDNKHIKPSTKFYLEMCELNNYKPNETLMVGNCITEDYPSVEAGLKFYLLTDNLKNKDNKEYNPTYEGTYKNFLDFVKQL